MNKKSPHDWELISSLRAKCYTFYVTIQGFLRHFLDCFVPLRFACGPRNDHKTNYAEASRFNQLALEIKQLGKDLGFDQIGITDTNLSEENIHLKKWVEKGLNGEMKYFKKNADIYEHPEKLLTNTIRVICCSMSYPKSPVIVHPLASFAQLEDYSTLVSQLLKELVEKINHKLKIPQNARVFAGNAPILEKALAYKAGLGWYGKHTILINENCGSFFCLGEILTDIPLPIDQPITNRCGDCTKCMEHCPTKALVAPGKLDARRCISYLTGSYKGSIPLELRPLIGTKVLGCDLCQQVCPWNGHLQIAPNNPFKKISHFAADNLIEWFSWSEKEFKEKVKNSPIKLTSYECWLRNIAVAFGNPPKTPATLTALKSRLNHPSALVREHVEWAIKFFQNP